MGKVAVEKMTYDADTNSDIIFEKTNDSSKKYSGKYNSHARK